MNSLKPFKAKPKKILLNHEFCKVVEENSQFILYVKMANGSYAVQAPYPADLRGAIGALTLALDVLAGKIQLGTTVQLNESEFSAENHGAVEIMALGSNKGGQQ